VQHSLVLRRCIFIAVDYVIDIVYNYVIARLARMIFIKLFEFSAVSFEFRRRVIQNIRRCARSSGYISSLRPAPRRRLVLPLRLLQQLRAALASSPHHFAPATVVEASSADPSDDDTWWCTLPRMSGIGNIGACHRPRGVSGPGKLGNVSPVGS
jgi:hypothetical protein